MVDRVKSYARETRGEKEGRTRRERGTPPPFPLWSPLVFFFLVTFFARAPLSERLKQATTTTTTTTTSKNYWFYANRSALCTSCITLFRTFLWRPLHDYDVKPPNARAWTYEDKFEKNFPFSFWNWIKSLRVQLQEKAPAFDKLSESK